MLEILLNNNKPLKLLCVGSHPDDIEIGCGGSLIKWLENDMIENIDWVIFSSNKERRLEAERSAAGFVNKKASLAIFVESYKDSFLPYQAEQIKNSFIKIKKTIDNPDLIFTNYRNDLHQDHSFISSLTHNLFRDHLILEYEIPKYDGDLGNPNIFIQLDQKIIDRKFELIDKYFISQKNNHWFSKDKLTAINILRGIQSNNLKKYSEAFYSSKLFLSDK
tara:strand:+ start:131 stop:790 length:660 start_codon:yes stop_codon:yes gene_type:complete